MKMLSNGAYSVWPDGQTDIAVKVHWIEEVHVRY